MEEHSAELNINMESESVQNTDIVISDNIPDTNFLDTKEKCGYDNTCNKIADNITVPTVSHEVSLASHSITDEFDNKLAANSDILKINQECVNNLRSDRLNVFENTMAINHALEASRNQVAEHDNYVSKQVTTDIKLVETNLTHLKSSCNNTADLLNNIEKVKVKKDVSERQSQPDDALSQLMNYGSSDSEDSESDSVSLSGSSDTYSIISDKTSTTKTNTIDESAAPNLERFRSCSSSDSSSTDYESDSSSDSSEAVGACGVTPTAPINKPVQKKVSTVVTKGELTMDDLPPIEELQISVTEEECLQMGIVSSIVEQLVIVQSLPGTPAYDVDTLLFLDRGLRPLGRVFDVLGPVTEPFYAVRFNNHEQAIQTGVKPGTAVYCAAHNSDHTAYVFVSELLKMKGSDASWKHNNEPPEMYLDFSDDEQERQARKLRSEKKQSKSVNSSSNSLERNKKFERQMNDKNTLMNERYSQPSTSHKPLESKRTFQPAVGPTPVQWGTPRPIPPHEFGAPPYQFGYFNQYGSFPRIPQFVQHRPPCAPVMMGVPGVFSTPAPFNPNIPPPVVRPQPGPYIPNQRHPRWPMANTSVLHPARGNFGNGPYPQ